MEILIGLVFLLLFITSAILLFFIFREAPQQRQSQKSHGRKSTQRRKKGTVPSHLQRQLLSMVGGNKATAFRLVESVRHKNPEKDERWCWEKAILDLERDRY